jgi:hypothetical protein
MVGIFGKELVVCGGSWVCFFSFSLPPLGWDLRRPIGMDVTRERAIELVRKYCENSDESKKPSSYSVVDTIEDTGLVVRAVTDKVESYYVVANVGAGVKKFSYKGSR